MSDIHIREVWAETLKLVGQGASRPTRAWLNQTEPVRLEEGRLVVAVPNRFVKEWINKRLVPDLHQALYDTLARPVEVQFVVAEQSDSEHSFEDAVPFPSAEVQTAAAMAPAPPALEEPDYFERRPPASSSPGGQRLNPRYTFDTFVIGSGNRMAHAASLAVAEAPARAYNPLFIYGGVGLGKTHLMQAIAHHVLQRTPRARVVYISSEAFTNEIIDGIRDGNTMRFRNRFRNVDVLLVDDVQFIAGKERTQEEFFHTFNALHEANRQIVLSSDRTPKEIPTLEERLRSRFEWGLISDIQPPDLETRIAILRKKAQLENLDIPDGVLRFVAERIATNIRELEGALIRLMAYSTIQNKRLDVELAAEILKGTLPPVQHAPLSLARIMELVADHFDMSTKDLKVRKRTRALVVPRQIAMYLCRQLTDASLPQIGEEFGGRDHTTVLHACDKISREIDENRELAQTITVLKQRIKRDG